VIAFFFLVRNFYFQLILVEQQLLLQIAGVFGPVKFMSWYVESALGGGQAVSFIWCNVFQILKEPALVAFLLGGIWRTFKLLIRGRGPLTLASSSSCWYDVATFATTAFIYAFLFCL